VYLTVLSDNTALPGFAKEWGLSLYIETPDGAVLFDAGQGPAMVANAAALNLDLSVVKTVGLSHGHFDHGDGLPRVFAAGYAGCVHAHAQALAPRYSLQPGKPKRYIGLSGAAQAALSARLTPVAATAELLPGLTMVSAVPRKPGAHQCVAGFYFDEACTEPDCVSDDAFLIWEQPESMAVIFGCCHAGLANSLDLARELTGGKPLSAVVGGLHLYDAGQAVLEESARVLGKADPARIIAGHCTGEKATAWLAERFPGRVTPLAAGLSVEL